MDDRMWDEIEIICAHVLLDVLSVLSAAGARSPDSQSSPHPPALDHPEANHSQP